MSLRIGGALRELRIHLCQTDKNAEGVRAFLTKNYVNIKKANPTFPILIRECKGVQPRVWARYEKGEERTLPLTDMSAADVMNTIAKLVK